ncbi:FHA domain-containing protein [Streptomyces sp. NBC_00496]|uniref:FHA domain-containing protein n=3 Tax=Streptomyces TaxID=1883 RepID=UPI002E180173
MRMHQNTYDGNTFDAGNGVRTGRDSDAPGSLHEDGTMVMQRWFLCSPNGRQILIPDDGVILGRANGIGHLRGTGVSRRHVELTPVPGGVQVDDLGSTNGVSVDGVATRRGTMRAGQVLRVGDTNYFLVHVYAGKRLFHPDH